MKNVWLASVVTSILASAFWVAVLLLSDAPATGSVESAGEVACLGSELDALRRELRGLQDEVLRMSMAATVRREELPPLAPPADDPLPELGARLDQAEGRVAYLTRRIDGIEEYLRFGGYEPHPMPPEAEAPALDPALLATLRTGNVWRERRGAQLVWPTLVSARDGTVMYLSGPADGTAHWTGANWTGSVWDLSLEALGPGAPQYQLARWLTSATEGTTEPAAQEDDQ